MKKYFLFSLIAIACNALAFETGSGFNPNNESKTEVNHLGTCTMCESEKSLAGDCCSKQVSSSCSSCGNCCNNVNAGYDKGFFIASKNCNFKLILNANIQFRFAWDHRKSPESMASPPQVHPTERDLFGFSNQRTALIFKGHVFDPSFTYFVQGLWGANYTDILLDAWIGKGFGKSWLIMAGKFRMPFMRETLVNYTEQLAVDRTLMSYYLGIGRSQGIQLKYQGDNLRLTVAAFEAFETIGGISALGPIGNTYNTIAGAGRVDWLVLGQWNAVKDYTAFCPDKTSLLIGGAVAYATLDQSLFSAGQPQQNDFRWTADVTLNCRYGSLAAAVVMAHLEKDPLGVLSNSKKAWGFNAQGAFFLTKHFQCFTRYEWADSMFNGDDLSLLQTGYNLYIYTQKIKWTTDVGYSFNQLPTQYFNLVQAPGVASGNNGGVSLTGWTPDAGSGQWLIRSQMQLSF